MKEEVTYRKAFGALWDGTRELITCLMRTGSLTLRDCGIFIVKHPIVIILLVLLFGSTITYLCRVIPERDEAVHKAYLLENSLDSLNIIYNIKHE